MHLRSYEPTDLYAVRQLFRETVERVNWRDYSPEQVAAWIGNDDRVTRDRWQKSLLTHQTLVAVEDATLLGFADMTATGYLDRLYVHYAHQGRGIARSLVRTLEEQVAANRYQTYASITARPFFEREGYRLIRETVVERAGVNLLNFEMQKN